LLVIDKPGGITSRAALDRAQRWFPRGTALGHTGTLDPLATGVLVLCVGRATRLAEYVQRMSKTYDAVFHLGATSDSDDADGTITPHAVSEVPSREAVEEALRGFLGAIEQVPPAYSAAKVAGQRAYALARRGRAPELAPRRVQVHRIAVMDYPYPRLALRIDCGKGTYIRSLARDLGARLGCGAYVEWLRRTRVGPFAAAAAITPEASAEEALAHLLPLSAAVAELPSVTLADDDIVRLRHGRRVPIAPLGGDATTVAVLDHGAVEHELLAGLERQLQRHSERLQTEGDVRKPRTNAP
jgi:tRNA pseudouridine55 synthase